MPFREFSGSGIPHAKMRPAGELAAEMGGTASHCSTCMKEPFVN
jgi:hypothetical protein